MSTATSSSDPRASSSVAAARRRRHRRPSRSSRGRSAPSARAPSTASATTSRTDLTGSRSASSLRRLLPCSRRRPHPGRASFLTDLQREFGERRRELLAARAPSGATAAARPASCPTSCPRRASVRESDWRVAPFPAEIADRRVEITGPVDRKMVINALNSGAKVFMADFEDANSPTWENCIEGQLNLTDALERTIDARHGREAATRSNDEAAVLFVRPRGWHLEERHFEVDGGADVGLACSTSASTSSATTARGGRYFYLPKLESHLEARLWNDVFVWAQERLGCRARDDQGDRPDRDDPRRVRDGRDPLRAARPLGRAERRPLGLHLQRDQEARPPARVRAPRPRGGDDGGAVHARLLRAAREDVPSPRRARDGRHGGVHPLPPRPRGERGRAREGARGQGARGGAGLRRHLGRAPRPRAGRDGDRSTGCSATGRTRSSGSATTSRSTAADLLDVAATPGEITEAGPAQQRLGRDPVPRGLAAGARARSRSTT